MVAGPLAGRLSDKIGPRTLIADRAAVRDRELALWQSRVTRSTRPTRTCSSPFILMGLGMGLAMSPMSTAAMNAVDPTKAGVASGVLSMSRMVGGTFGVAAMGALITGLGRSKIDETLRSAGSARHNLAEASAPAHRRERRGPRRRAGRVPRRPQQRPADRRRRHPARRHRRLDPHRRRHPQAPAGPRRRGSEVGTGDGGSELAARAETALA